MQLIKVRKTYLEVVRNVLFLVVSGVSWRLKFRIWERKWKLLRPSMCYDTFSKLPSRKKYVEWYTCRMWKFGHHISFFHLQRVSFASLLSSLVCALKMAIPFLSLGFQTFSLNITTQRQISIAVRSVAVYQRKVLVLSQFRERYS